jgi:hypothetical protein
MRSVKAHDGGSAERRTRNRVRIDCPAELVLLSRRFAGRLLDLSSSGARLDLNDAPPSDATGMLKWLDYEVYCSVVWVNETSCGISFERRIPVSAVDATVAAHGLSNEEVIAEIRHIPFGSKRSSLLK